MFDPWRGFADKKLSEEKHTLLSELARQARGNILTMTTIANSGHPGGSMSSLEMYLTLYHFAKVDPTQPKRDDRDRIIISHGHTSPGAYSALAANGFFDITPALHGFRQGGSPFEGHVEQSVPGIEWDTGNLGQGLSVGVGKALYARLSGLDFHTYVMMGDGEQQKGQIAEARRTALKFGLKNLTALVDYNRLQISGEIGAVMPQEIRAGWESDGWQVVEIDGHDLHQVYEALRQATHKAESPVMILAHTVMGKGVGSMENKAKYHGSALPEDQLEQAFAELGGFAVDLEALKARRRQGPPPHFAIAHSPYPKVDPGTPIIRPAGTKTDNRSAWGEALVSVAQANLPRAGFVMAVFDCDLAGSVKTNDFEKKFPDNFFQCGISEHSTAATAGALSAETALAIWSDFGVFGVDEVYNQNRLNDINHSNLNLFCTHTGVNVGEDGKTHQCIDFFALLNSTFGWKVITPADPNQTDHITRYVLATPGNFGVFMGRAKMQVVLDENRKPFFGEDYIYRYGRMDIIRPGHELVLVSAGNMLPDALKAWETLKADSVDIALVSVSDWSDLHPEDIAMLGGYAHVVTLEDHNVKTGLGSQIGLELLEAGQSPQLTRFGVSHYAASGTPDELYKLLGIDGVSVAEKIKLIMNKQSVKQ
jgi:transketolase